MTDEQLEKALKLAQLMEIHGKMGGTKPFDRLLAPLARELNAFADELEEEEKAAAQEDRERAELEQAQRNDELKAVQDGEAEQAERNRQQIEEHARSVPPRQPDVQRTLDLDAQHADVTRRI